jgi:hypothetical protein
VQAALAAGWVPRALAVFIGANTKVLFCHFGPGHAGSGRRLHGPRRRSDQRLTPQTPPQRQVMKKIIIVIHHQL